MKRYRVIASEILGFNEIINANNKEEALRIFEDLHSKRKLSPDSSEGLEGIETFELKDWEQTKCLIRQIDFTPMGLAGA